MIKVSPGVYFREIDLSLYIPRLSQTILAVVGTAPKGPTNKATLITNLGAFTNTFGVPHPNHLATYSAAQFLRFGDQLWFVRVNGADAVASTVSVHGATAAGSVIATKRGTFAFADSTAAVMVGTETTATRTVLSTNKKLLVAINGGPAITITLTEGVGLTKAAIAAEIDAALAAYGASVASPGNAITITTDLVGSAARIEFYSIANDAYTLLGFTAGSGAAEVGTDDNRSISFETFTDGVSDNTLTYDLTAGASRTVDQVVAELNIAFAGDTMTLVASNYDGYLKISHTNASQHDSFSITTTSPSAVNLGGAKTLGLREDTVFVGRGVSPSSETVVFTALSVGEWGNNIKVRVSNGSALNTFRVTVLEKDQIVEVFDNLVGTSETEDLSLGKKYFQSAINGTGEQSVSKYISVGDTIDNTGYPINGDYQLLGGTDGLDSISDDDFVGSINGNLRTGLQIFAHAEQYDINLLICPGISTATVINEMIAICETRGDCMAIVDPPLGLGVQQMMDWHNGATVYSDHGAFNSSYAALYWPWAEFFDAANDRHVWTPPSGHAAAVYAYSDEVAEPWFAPAGFQRGRVLQVTRLEYPADQGERDALYGNQNAVNPLVKFQKDGIAIWGQRTLQRKPSYLDRVNVRRLMLYIRKVVSTATRYLVFEPNDPVTWRTFAGLVDPFMKSLVAKRGVRKYLIVCDETTNTPDHISNNEMVAKIFLEPTTAAEKIMIDAVLTPSGASFEEVTY